MILETDKEDLWFYIKKRLIGLKSTGQIPTGHIHAAGPFTTTSATLVDITGMVVTVTNAIDCCFQVDMTGEVSSVGAGSAVTIGYALSIDGVDTDEQHVDLTHADADETIAILHITAMLSAGTHTFKARMRRAAGTQTAQFTGGMMSGIAFQAVVGFVG